MTASRQPLRNLVTGGTGFIGERVVAALLARGEKVRVLDLKRDGLSAEVEFIEGSITNPNDAARAAAGMDAVFHVAGDPELWNRRTGHFDNINCGGTATMLEASRAAGVRSFVYTSSATVLVGRGDAGRRVDETRDLTPGEMLGPYSRSKLMAEALVLKAATPGFRCVSVIPTLPIGAGDRNLTPPTRLIRDLLVGAIPAYLDHTLNLVDVEDLAQGHIAARDRGQGGERYILGGTNIRLGQLLVLLETMTGVAMPKRTVPGRLAHVVSLVSESWSNHVSGRPPTAPISGVAFARNAPAFENGRACKDLGLTFRTPEKALYEEVRWLLDQGHITGAMDVHAPEHALPAE